MKTPATKTARLRRARVHDAAGPVPRVDRRESAEPLSIVSRCAAFMEPADPQGRLAMIAEAAFYLAERRRFDPGHELDDWLEAERSVDRLLQSGQAETEQTRIGSSAAAGTAI